MADRSTIRAMTVEHPSLESSIFTMDSLFCSWMKDTIKKSGKDY